LVLTKLLAGAIIVLVGGSGSRNPV